MTRRILLRRMTPQHDDLRRQVPPKLQALPQWVVWREVKRNGRLTKVPFDVKTGSEASSTNPATWSTFGKALATFEANPRRWNGIGFVFTEDCGLVGVDLDGVLDPATGRFRDWPEEFLTKCAGDVPSPRKIIRMLDTYAEISPSGRGVKLFCRGKLPPGGNRRGNKDAGIEVYDTARYFTVTGKRFGNAPIELAECGKEIAELHRAVFGGSAKFQATPRESTPKTAAFDSDDELIRAAGEARNGDKFRRLWAGEWEDYSSRSEADIALADILAFWTGPDPGHIERLLWQSRLARDKWQREDYLRRTIDKALQNRVEFYNSVGDDAQHSKATTTSQKKARLTSTATKLINLANECVLWHTRDGHAYATIPVDSHVEHWPIHSKGFRLWLRHKYFDETKSAPNAQAVQDALNVLESRAVYDGPEETISIRLGELDGNIYLRPLRSTVARRKDNARRLEDRSEATGAVSAMQSHARTAGATARHH